MTQPVQKRATPSQQTGERGETTGRYAIDDVAREGTASEQVDEVSLEELGAVMEAEAATRRSQPPASERGMVSGVFSSEPLDAQPVAERPSFEDPALAALSDSLEPYHRRDEVPDERAVLEIEDFSLRGDNPYLASSLIPAPRRRAAGPSWLALVALALAMALACTVFLLVRAPTSQPPRQSLAAQTNSARPAPAPVPSAPEADIAKPSAPLAPVPEQAPVAMDSVRKPIPTQEAAVPAARLLAAAPRTESQPEATQPAAAATAVEATTSVPASDGAPIAVITGVPPTAEGAAIAAPSSAAATVVEAPAAQVADTAALAAALPEVPTREDVATGFQSIQDQLVQCAAGRHGVAKIAATIANSGRVSSALIQGQFQGSPEGSCMARAVRSARFPQFSQPSLKVTYPIAF